LFVDLFVCSFVNAITSERLNIYGKTWWIDAFFKIVTIATSLKRSQKRVRSLIYTVKYLPYGENIVASEITE